jgi:hypothetical protein
MAARWIVAGFHQWYVKAAGDNVDVLVNASQSGTWSHPAHSGSNGANKLRDIPRGAVGLAGNALAASGSVVCDYLRVEFGHEVNGHPRRPGI